MCEVERRAKQHVRIIMSRRRVHNTTNAFDATISDLQSYKMQLDQQLIENARLTQSIKLLQNQLDEQHKAHANSMERVTETHHREVERLRADNERLRTKLQLISDSSNLYHADAASSSDASVHNAYLAQPPAMRDHPRFERGGTSHDDSKQFSGFY